MLGFLNLFKPAGPTSTQFGARLRKMYASHDGGKLAVGHMGTLDPQAAGVLPVALGRATRLLPLIEDRRKAYAFTLVLGRATDTADAVGATIATAPLPDDLDARLDAALGAFVGAIEQIPPMFSAVHHEGKRLHELARAGIIVERAKRAVTIYALTVLGRDGDVVRMRVACSSPRLGVPLERTARPDNSRSSTDPSPSPSALLQELFRDQDKSDWAFPRPTSSGGSSHSRNRSPYSRSHLRSRSSGAALLSAPPMTRAHSLPNPHISKPFETKSGRESPLRSRSPAYRNEERSPSWFETSSSATSLSGSSGASVSALGIEAIQEDSELDLTPRAYSQSNSPLTQHSASFSRSVPLNRRRPASPLHAVSPTPSVSLPAGVIDQGVPINVSATPSSGSNSPMLGPQKYNEPHPAQMLHHYAPAPASPPAYQAHPLRHDPVVRPSPPSTPSRTRRKRKKSPKPSSSESSD